MFFFVFINPAFASAIDYCQESTLFLNFSSISLKRITESVFLESNKILTRTATTTTQLTVDTRNREMKVKCYSQATSQRRLVCAGLCSQSFFVIIRNIVGSRRCGLKLVTSLLWNTARDMNYQKDVMLLLYKLFEFPRKIKTETLNFCGINLKRKGRKKFLQKNIRLRSKRTCSN